MTVLSLGAGVQSSTMALMAANGEIDVPDCAIFADTGWEPKAVYEWLDWLEKQLPYPVYRVQRGNLRDDLISGSNTTGQKFAAVPFFNSNGGLGRRQCTSEYKLTPIRKKIRSLGATAKDPCTVLIGISLDETHRMKPSRVKYIVNEYPLVDRRLTRSDCINWMQRHGFEEPPRSSCLGCPFHGDHFWRALKEKGGKEWEDTVYMDSVIRVQPKFDGGEQYIHRSLKPLDEVDLRTDADYGQQDLWGNECEGMCGV